MTRFSNGTKDALEIVGAGSFNAGALPSGANNLTTAYTQLTTFTTAGLGELRAAILFINTGTNDAFVTVDSGTPEFIIPAGSHNILPLGGGFAAIYAASVSGATTLYCKELGY